jgi:hypothetical protein
MACDQINKKFPKLNVSVEYNTDVDRAANELTESSDNNDDEVEA